MTLRYRDFGDNPYMFAPPEWCSTNMRFILAVFDALKTQALMNKLAGGNKPYLDGVELRRAVAPQVRGLASYWLERCQSSLNLMKQQELIYHIHLSVGRYGYGDDKGFELSHVSSNMIAQLGNDRRIKQWVREQILYG